MLLLLSLLLLPDAMLNRPYSPEARWERVSARCALPIPSARLVSGAAPPGMHITSKGEVEGIPTEPGVFVFGLEISDGCSNRLEQRSIRVAPAPILTAEAESQELHCAQGAQPFAAGIVRVSGSSPGRPYSVDILDGEWLRALMRDGVLPPEGAALDADNLRLSVDPAKLTPGTYSARLRVSTWQGANAPELLFRLRVDAAQTTLAPIVPASTPAPTIILLQIAEAPNVGIVQPPEFDTDEPPLFPKYVRKPKAQGLYGTRSSGRSRVLPFPKVVIPPKPKAAAPARTDVPAATAQSKPAAKKEAPPDRTKPAAMPAAK